MRHYSMNSKCKTYPDGTKRWYLNDKLHRTDGPAIEYPDGTTYWYLKGKRINPKKLVNRGYMTEADLMLYLI